MSSLDLTPVTLSALSVAAVSPADASTNGPSEVGDTPVWNGNGYDFLNYWYDVRSYGAVGDGVTDDAAAIQEAVDALMAAGRGVLKFGGPHDTFRLASTVTFTPTAATTDNILIDGGGCRIQSAVASLPVFRFTKAATTNTWRNWVLSNFTMLGSASAESEMILVESTTAPGSISRFAIKDVVMETVYGHGIHVKGYVFEFLLENCRISMPSSVNTTKSGIRIDANSIGGGAVQTTARNCFVSGGKYGYEAVTAGDHQIIGGVYLSSQNEGIYLRSQGGQIVGAHAEDNWASAANQAAGGGGVYFEGWGQLVGLSSKATTNQKWAASVYSSHPQSPITVVGYQGAGNAGFTFLKTDAAASGGTVNLIGVPRNEVTEGSNVTHRYVEQDGTRALKFVTAKAETLDRRDATANNLALLTSGTLYLCAIYLPAGLLVSNIGFVSGGTGVTGPTNQWFALYDKSLGKLGVTADDLTTAWGGTTAKTLALTSAYTTTYDGLYYLGIMVACSGAIGTVSGTAILNAVAGLTPRLSFNTNSTGLTVPAGAPATAVFAANVANLPYGYVT